jgi:AAA+ superfamily predicted ATPase
MKLNKYLDNFSLKSIVKIAEGLSHAEITDACNDALKEIILSNKSKVSEDLLATMIKEKKVNYFNQ